MKSIVLIVITLLFLVSLYILIKHRGTIEGFLDKPEIDNTLFNVISKLKHVAGYLTDPKSWIERISLANMTPVELARHYIKSQAKERGDA
jgi:hypothetical protein